jgi:hypothetical protein
MAESSLFFLALEVCDTSGQFDIHSLGSPIWQRTRALPIRSASRHQGNHRSLSLRRY